MKNNFNKRISKNIFIKLKKNLSNRKIIFYSFVEKKIKILVFKNWKKVIENLKKIKIFRKKFEYFQKKSIFAYLKSKNNKNKLKKKLNRLSFIFLIEKKFKKVFKSLQINLMVNKNRKYIENKQNIKIKQNFMNFWKKSFKFLIFNKRRENKLKCRIFDLIIINSKNFNKIIDEKFNIFKEKRENSIKKFLFKIWQKFIEFKIEKRNFFITLDQIRITKKFKKIIIKWKILTIRKNKMLLIKKKNEKILLQKYFEKIIEKSESIVKIFEKIEPFIEVKKILKKQKIFQLLKKNNEKLNLFKKLLNFYLEKNNLKRKYLIFYFLKRKLLLKNFILKKNLKKKKIIFLAFKFILELNKNNRNKIFKKFFQIWKDFLIKKKNLKQFWHNFIEKLKNKKEKSKIFKQKFNIFIDYLEKKKNVLLKCSAFSNLKYFKKNPNFKKLNNLLIKRNDAILKNVFILWRNNNI